MFLEDRDGDNVGEFLRPGPATLADGTTGTLEINSTGQFAGDLKFVDAAGKTKTVTPAKLVAEQQVDPRWDGKLLTDADMGLMSMFSDATGCTDAALITRDVPAAAPLLLDDRSPRELLPDVLGAIAGVLGDLEPAVAARRVLDHARRRAQWDTAGTPAGGSAGFIFLMRIPFAEILTGNDTSVATLMPGPKTTSIQGLYAGASTLDLGRTWLDVASLSNNQYADRARDLGVRCGAGRRDRGHPRRPQAGRGAVITGSRTFPASPSSRR